MSDISNQKITVSEKECTSNIGVLAEIKKTVVFCISDSNHIEISNSDKINNNLIPNSIKNTNSPFTNENSYENILIQSTQNMIYLNNMNGGLLKLNFIYFSIIFLLIFWNFILLLLSN